MNASDGTMVAETQGVHHVGLTVSDLHRSADFFTRLLGWSEVRRNDEYPAIFVSDGQIMLTLWQAQTDFPVEFNRKTNIGLHHLALSVENEAALNRIYERLISADIRVEFAPQPVNGGPAKHMMCYDPSGLRIEFFSAPAV